MQPDNRPLPGQGDTRDRARPDRRAFLKTVAATAAFSGSILEAVPPSSAAPAADSDAEKAVVAAKAEGRTEALAAANERLVKAEVRIAAAGKLADPADAVRFLDLADFKVDDDGNVDAKSIGKAIDQLLKDKPYLAPGHTGKPSGSGDGEGPSPHRRCWPRRSPASRCRLPSRPSSTPAPSTTS